MGTLCVESICNSYTLNSKSTHVGDSRTSKTYQALLDFVSDFASGVPKFVEELVNELIDSKAIEVVMLDLAYVIIAPPS